MESPPDDPQYLKNYVKAHPHNKMAWYLLGREYAAKGETGKAKYCFTQAGEVYEAFEKEGFPTLPAAPSEAPSMEKAGVWHGARPSGTANGGAARGRMEYAACRRAVSGRAMLWRTITAVLLIVLAGHIPYSGDTDRNADSIGAGEAGADKAAVFSTAGTDPAAANSGNGREAAGSGGDREGKPGDRTADSLGVVFLRDDAGGGSGRKLRAEQLGALLQSVTDSPGAAPGLVLLVQAQWSEDRRWLLWTKPPKLLLSAERAEDGAGARLHYYDAEACACEPADSAVAAARYAEWQTAQVQRLAVRSAVMAYEAANGRAPETIRELAANYPNNVLSGYTPSMKSYFDQWANGEAKADDPAAEPSGPGASPPRTPAASFGFLPSEEALKEPLRIIVDKTTHRLALVSGRVILRSYPVGLGGDRTPEGEFAISEKVRNPNGKDNGEFGSRGMTLSDTLYAIHGTNQPSSIGKDKSLGCIRMLKPDIEELFDLVPKGTKVTIGKGLLPADILRADVPIRVPPAADETNPGKTYKWLGYVPPKGKTAFAADF